MKQEILSKLLLDLEFLSAKEISKKYNISSSYVYHISKKYDIKNNNLCYKRNFLFLKKIIDEKKLNEKEKYIVSKYLDSGTFQKTATILGMSKQAVSGKIQNIFYKYLK